MSGIKPLVVNWEGLQKMGWPFSRTQTWRKMGATIEVSSRVKGVRVTKVIPNPDRFPLCKKLGWHRSSPVVWLVSEVLAYFEAHGLSVSDDWYAPHGAQPVP
jgi:hypothetical protein